MSHYVYILYSEKLNKYYVGKSADPNKRLQYHNSDWNKIWSRRGQPWKLSKVVEFKNSTEASKAEIHIKRQKSRKLIKWTIDNGWESI